MDNLSNVILVFKDLYLEIIWPMTISLVFLTAFY